MVESIVESVVGSTSSELVSAAFWVYAVTLVIMLLIRAPGLGWQFAGDGNIAAPAGWMPFVAIALLLYNAGMVVCLSAAEKWPNPSVHHLIKIIVFTFIICCINSFEQFISGTS